MIFFALGFHLIIATFALLTIKEGYMGTEGIQYKYINTNASELNEFYRLKNFRDWYSVVSTAEKKGMEKGREEGAKETNLNNARNLKQLGVATDIISQATGLSDEEIEKL